MLPEKKVKTETFIYLTVGSEVIAFDARNKSNRISIKYDHKY